MNKTSSSHAGSHLAAPRSYAARTAILNGLESAAYGAAERKRLSGNATRIPPVHYARNAAKSCSNQSFAKIIPPAIPASVAVTKKSWASAATRHGQARAVETAVPTFSLVHTAKRTGIMTQTGPKDATSALSIDLQLS